mgnify:CR=1 FL=1|jgi:hypothetical protein
MRPANIHFLTSQRAASMADWQFAAFFDVKMFALANLWMVRRRLAESLA